MAVIALADQSPGGGGLANRPLDLAVLRIEDLDRLRSHNRPVALVEIGDTARQGRERERVRADEHLARAVADGERARTAGADQKIVLAGKQEDERESPFEPPQRLFDRLL